MNKEDCPRCNQKNKFKVHIVCGECFANIQKYIQFGNILSHYEKILKYQDEGEK